MTSLRARLGFGLLLSLAGMFAVLWLIVGLTVRSMMEEQLTLRLIHDGDSLLGGIDFDAQGKMRLDRQRIQGIYQQPFSGHYFLIEAGGQIVRSRSLWDETLPLAGVAMGEVRVSHHVGLQRQPLLLVSRGFQKQGRQIRMVVAEEVLSMEAGIGRLQLQLLIWSGAAVFGLLLIQRFIVLRSLRSVDASVRDIARLERGEIHYLGEQVADEIRPLVQAFNSLLERQQQRLRRSREALGNMAHAIKTPLTLIRQIAHEGTMGSDADNDGVYRDLQHYAEQIGALLDTSLRRARLAGDSLGSGRFDLRRDLPALIDTLRRLYADKPLKVNQHIDHSLVLPLEQQDGMELLGNLLDNAWKWAEHEISLTIIQAEDLLIKVEDDGPGVDQAIRQEILQRGVRHDEASSGHGIGLSIVNSIVGELGGRLFLLRSEALGGLQVEVRFSISRDIAVC